MNEINKSTILISEKNLTLKAKYSITGWFYDILDYPWERQYKYWRPELLKDVRGLVFEAGVGTGRNLKYYHSDVELTGIDLSPTMLARAKKRAKHAVCRVNLYNEDAIVMQSVQSDKFDWIISTFLCCVMPDILQPAAIKNFSRILKVGGRFRLLEIIYSKNPAIKRRQTFFAPFVEKIYGARFDRNTLNHIKKLSSIEINNTYFLKDDTYMVIEGTRVK